MFRTSPLPDAVGVAVIATTHSITRLDPGVKHYVHPICIIIRNMYVQSSAVDYTAAAAAEAATAGR